MCPLLVVGALVLAKFFFVLGSMRFVEGSSCTLCKGLLHTVGLCGKYGMGHDTQMLEGLWGQQHNGIRTPLPTQRYEHNVDNTTLPETWVVSRSAQMKV